MSGSRKAAALSQELTRDNWPIRRRWMFRVLLWAMANAQGIIIASVSGYIASSNSILEQALIALLTLIAAIVGSYVFGAIWDDKNKRRFLTEADDAGYQPPGPEPYTPPPSPFTANETGPN
ncbi:MAG TPA: hypothetical protein VGC14_02050 [Rhizobium sp.]